MLDRPRPTKYWSAQAQKYLFLDEPLKFYGKLLTRVVGSVKLLTTTNHTSLHLERMPESENFLNSKKQNAIYIDHSII